jgi:hypothetical protein
MLGFSISWSQSTFSVQGADTGAFNPIDLIEEVCLGPGIQVVDIEFEGDPSSVGRFSGGSPFVDIGEGFIMTTGHAANLSGGAGADSYSQVTSSVSNDSQVPYYPELAALANSTDMHDLAVYTITFIPSGDTVSFKYVFASEEYPSYVCSGFNDAFAFFLEGPDNNGVPVTTNLAQIPGTDLPVSINSVNGGIPGSHPTVSLAFCNDMLNGSLDYAQFFNTTPNGTFPTYNGYTDVFEAKAAVTPCQQYTMTLAIADFGDPFWDSAIFFEAESFCSVPTQTIDTLPIVIEGCAPPSIPIDLERFSDAEFPLFYFVAGTAQLGQDYFGLDLFGEIEQPIDTWELLLPILNEGVEEGLETIEINFQGGECEEYTVVIPIADPLQIQGPSMGLCSVEPVTLEVTGDPAVLEQFEFEWSTGETTPSITVLPVQSELYLLTYSDEQSSCTAAFDLQVTDPEANLELTLCSNDDGIVVNGTLYDFYNPSGTEIIENGSVAGCDSIVHIQITPEVQAAIFPEVCQNESIIINGTVYDRDNPSGFEVLSGAAANGCDSVVRINVMPLEVSMSSIREEVCENEELIINGTSYNLQNPIGTEILEGAAVNGCDSIINVELEFLPTFTTALEEIINEGEAYAVGNESFTASGEYSVVLSAQNGCDSIVNLRLLVQTMVSTLTDSIAIGQSETACVNTEIFQQISSFTNDCPQPAGGTDFVLDAASGCLEYTGLAEGIDTACLIACDAFGVCDTTYLIVSVFENLLAAVDDYDTTLYNEPLTVEVLANDWTSETVVDTQYIVGSPQYGDATLNPDGTITYDPTLNACLQSDIFSYAICNATGCDTAEVYIYLDDVTGQCSGVWPGDVNNDGIVNQIDHWAVGLAYGENGPVRPNASFEWVAQPAINWNGTFTFITEINLKYADCNGTGQINTDDVGPIYFNWGKTHLSPFEYQFPEKEMPTRVEQSVADESITYEIHIGDSNRPLTQGYGFGFAIAFDPGQVESLDFDPAGSVLGIEGEQLMVLEKVDYENGRAYVSLVRTDHLPVNGFGILGALQLDCPTGDCGLLEIDEMQLLQIDGNVFEIPGSIRLEAQPVHTHEAIEQVSLSLFPNPATDRLQAISGQAGTYRLLAANGQLAQAGRLEAGSNEWTLENCSPGLYILQAVFGDQVVVRKLIVE